MVSVHFRFYILDHLIALLCKPLAVVRSHFSMTMQHINFLKGPYLASSSVIASNIWGIGVLIQLHLVFISHGMSILMKPYFPMKVPKQKHLFLLSKPPPLCKKSLSTFLSLPPHLNHHLPCMFIPLHPVPSTWIHFLSMMNPQIRKPYHITIIKH